MRDVATKRSLARWTTVCLGEVIDIINEYWDRDTTVPERLVAGEHIDEGDLRVRRWAMTDDELIPPTFNRWFRSGDVLLHSRNIKKVAQPDFGGITGEKLFILRTKDESVLLQALVPFLVRSHSFREYAESRWAGSTNKFLNKTPLEEFKFARPPIEEQRRLGCVLSAAQAVCDCLHTAIQQGYSVRDCLIARLLEFGINGESRRKTDMGRFPRGWEVLPLQKRYDVQLGKMISPATRAGGSQVPYMRNANVQWGRLDLSDVATMSIAESERERFGLRTGDILACEGRHVGKSVIWSNEIPGACYQKALHRLRPHNPSIDLPAFMLLCLRLYSISGRFTHATGETTIPHLPAERFREIVFPFPPIDEQRVICARVADLDRQLGTARERLDAQSRVLESLMREVIR